MEFSTNHDNVSPLDDYAFRIWEEVGEDEGFNNAEISIRINEYIDSRTELNMEIQKRALEFLKRAAAALEAELSK